MIIGLMILLLSIIKLLNIPHITSIVKLRVKKRKYGFGLLVYSDETVNGIIELLEKIYSDQHCYIIHFDSKTPLRSIELFTSLYPDIKQTKQQYDIEWGSFEIVKAELEMLFTDIQCDYDHFMFLDGASYPLQPLHMIEKELNRIPIMNSVLFSNDPGYGSRIPTCKKDSPTLSECDRTEARCVDETCTQYTTTPYHGPVYKGPQWVILSRAFINFLKIEKDLVDQWIDFFEWHSRIPDESFFQTIFMNSVFRDYDFLYKEDWIKTVWKDCKSGNTLFSEMGWSPCPLGVLDYDFHLENSTALFTRKIEPGSDLKAMIFDRYTTKNEVNTI